MDHSEIGVSSTLASHAASTTYAGLPDDVLPAFKRALLDFLACAIAGSTMPVSNAMLSYFEENDASRAATVLGSGRKLSASNAAFVNGANAHGLDFDDGYMQAAAHPGAAVFPAVLARAEQLGSSAQDVITAIVIGYDVMLRIGAAIHPVAAQRGFHNTAIAGVFGAAAGVANLAKLDSKQTLNALGLAGSFASGIREYLDEGAEVKRIHPGKAARDGLLCAEFAARGITGPSKVLEGRYGLFHTHVDDQVRWERLLDGLGTRYEIASIYFKPYPSCRGTHAFIEGIQGLRAQHGFSPEQVAHVELGGNALSIHAHDYKHHENVLDAQMSVPYTAALAVLYGDVTAQMFLPETMERPEVDALVQRVDAYVDDECERMYPAKRSAVVRIQLENGRKLEKRLVDPKGDLDNPMSDDDLARKFRGNCEPVIGTARCSSLLDQVRRFEALDDVRLILQ
jgi:2-methylcitrate dehydratase PrpD